jgi:hypothetical protein
MRTASRKLRPFRPATLALESISPVSSLAVAMPPAAPTTAGQVGTTSVRVDQPTRFAPMPSSLAASPSLATTAIDRALGGGLGSVAATSPIAMPQAAQSSPAVTVDVGRYANAITIASVNAPPTRPSGGRRMIRSAVEEASG